ncbi:MAG: hypothetical protein J0I06_24405 [Planctomycetes bacterium]|nr:hypothetical protein [Planctomycetota bacterium]
MKDFATNATDEPLSRVLLAAFRRATIEHEFRVAKTEAGLMHYEGRQWLGLVRHLVLSLVVLGFVSIHTDRLWGENPLVTMEQLCRALNGRCASTFRRRRKVADRPHVGEVIRYHQQRNERATKSHKKRRHRSVI